MTETDIVWYLYAMTFNRLRNTDFLSQASHRKNMITAAIRIFAFALQRHRCRSVRSIVPVVASLCFAVFIPQTFGQEPVSLENQYSQEVLVIRDPRGHWTPTALRDATLQALPEPSVGFEQLTSVGSAASRGNETKVLTLSDLEAAFKSVNGDKAVIELDELIAFVVAHPSVKEDYSFASIDGEDGNGGAEVHFTEPDLEDRLFAEEIEDVERPTVVGVEPLEVEPADVGAYAVDAPFSSSRLIPIEARLAYPYRAVGKLFFTVHNGSDKVCSGAVLRPRLVLTAGHCVHSGSADGFYENFLFIPAYHEGQAPFQAWNWSWVTTTGSWVSSNGTVPNKADFAIIEVEDRIFDNQVMRIGDVVGWLGYRTNALHNNHTKKIGYPGNHDQGQIMHQVDSQDVGSGTQNTWLYGSDMGRGSSGGPWVMNFGMQAVGQSGGHQPWPNRIVGVTSYGFRAASLKVQGSSILDDEFLKILNVVCGRQSGNC